MNKDVELDVWRGQWQAQSNAPIADDLRDQVARETRRMKVGLIAPVLVTLLIGGPIARQAVISSQWDAVVLAAEVWLFIAVVWAGSIWIGRGTFRPLGETTAAFIELSIRRCRSSLRAAQFGAVLYLCQLLFVMFWNLRYSPIGMGALVTSWPVIVLGWLGLPAVFVSLPWYARRKRAELATLLDLRRQFGNEAAGGRQ